MARGKATITLDRERAHLAMGLTGIDTMSEVIDLALGRLIAAERLRRDVGAYLGRPLTHDELSLADLPVALDLGDEDVDYDALYATPP